jgi:asparagine synthase (glutamine-hydrolysing)
MCGIAGVVGRSPTHLQPLLEMTTALKHRGPDDEGYVLVNSRSGGAWVFGGSDTLPALGLPPLPTVVPEGVDVGLGHRRLSILDLGPGGHGPMASPDERYWVTYNGEIYNYLELREQLRGLGREFRTSSDTEVLLAAWAEWGPAALDRFNGMWAFALYDARDRVLHCARDRFGVKPFHYYWDGELCAFASEIKGLLAHPLVPCRPRERMVLGFLARGALDEGEHTFFEGILSLPAAHRLSLDVSRGRLEVARWYEPPSHEARECDAERFRALLEDSVRLRLRSDVDVGTCLSGGLDSSSIVALTARLRDPAGDGGRRAFSIVYDDPGLAEGIHVATMVVATGVVAARTTATSADLLRDLPELVRHQDEPIPSPGPYSHWRVMALAHEAGVKVLLDGQGADEVLAGYHYHFGPYLAEIARTKGLRAALPQARAAHQVTGRSLAFLLGLMAYHLLPVPGPLRDAAVLRFATHGRLPMGMLDPALVSSIGLLPGRRHRPQTSLASERRDNLWLTSLPALLRYEDRNSMAFGIEARTPFLDYRLVEEALALRSDALIRDGWTKAVLRDAMRGILPEAVRLRRDKLGFPTPESRFLRELASQVREWLGQGSRVASRLRSGALRRWLAEPDDRLAGRPGLWRLVSAELWLRYIERAR